ncbi:nucleotidyltransferase domain-containing protein [Candidatus Woesearchaeota archaeon]|nr:nucleotidyltransferase domain-containing protein [Candidatus Woesearchaeota archaeon]
MEFLKKVLEEYALTAEEKQVLDKKIDDFICLVNTEIQKEGIKAKAVLGGSAAKGTFLKNDFDCDVFVMFDYGLYKDQSSSLSDYTEKILKNAVGKPVRLHGSRDYFQMKKELQFEIIPVLDIGNDAKKAINVTDVSPLHTSWILGNIKKRPELRDQIVLTKLFFKAQHLYGAESYIQGFSGHVIDILITHYGSFLRLLTAATSWKDRVIIDVQHHYGDNPILHLNKAKIVSPLILIDPIQPERNASSSLSVEKFELLRKKAQEFLAVPSPEFFVRTQIKPELLRKKNKDVLLICAKPLRGKKDVVGSKLLKVFLHLKTQLEAGGFSLTDAGWDWSKDALFWFEVKEKEISPFFIHHGPPMAKEQAVAAFKKKHKDCFSENSRVYAKLKREFTLPLALLKKHLTDQYVQERVASIRLLAA